jgi:hypothetical protein
MYAPKTFAQLHPQGGRNFIILFARAEYSAVDLDRMNIKFLTGQNNYEFSPFSFLRRSAYSSAGRSNQQGRQSQRPSLGVHR